MDTMVSISRAREILADREWETLWSLRDNIDWTYAIEHVPFDIQWRMVIASHIEEYAEHYAQRATYAGVLKFMGEHIQHRFAIECARMNENVLPLPAVAKAVVDAKEYWIEGAATIGHVRMLASRLNQEYRELVSKNRDLDFLLYSAYACAEVDPMRSALGSASNAASFLPGKPKYLMKIDQIGILAKLVVKYGLEPMPRDASRVSSDMGVGELS